ncbi:12622_t:CDS:2, partial [Ambispora leptoticha]
TSTSSSTRNGRQISGLQISSMRLSKASKIIYVRCINHPHLKMMGQNSMNDGEKYFPHNDQDLREMLRIFVSKNNLKFTVFIETPSKAFSDWSFPKVCQLYELCESDDPSLSVFPPFTCEYKDLENDSPRNLKLEQDQAERESKKNRKFQTRCIQIAKEILNDEPMIEYRPSFLNGLELDAFFQKHQIALEVQGAQHRFHSTSWYKDVKKLEDIVNRDRQKDACVKIMESSCLRYGTMKTQKLSSPKEYKKLRVSLIKHPEFSTYSQFIMYNLISNHRQMFNMYIL